jgi:hypothetical protein
MPTTNADKRHRVKVAMERFPGRSNVWIAEVCGVGRTLVASLRPEHAATASSPPVRVGKDGKARRMPTPKPRPAIPAWFVKVRFSRVGRLAETAGRRW